MKKHNYIIILFLFVSHSIFSNGSDVKISTDEIPIIFVHIGYSPELEYSLWQALQYNKNIILISDDENNKHGLNVQYYDIAQFKNEADQFAKEYVHLSRQNNAPEYIQLARFARWFVIKAFMEQYNIPVCFHCDSDVMIYTNIADNVKEFEPFDLALVADKAFCPDIKESSKIKFAPRFSDCTVLIRKELLDDYCKFLHKFYTDKNNIDELLLLRHSRSLPKLVGGMFLITRYMDITNAQEKFIIKNICEIKNDNVFDSSLHKSFSGQFNVIKENPPRAQYKDIQWINNQPYSYNKELNKMVRFNTLHFSDCKKDFMKDFRRLRLSTKP